MPTIIKGFSKLSREEKIKKLQENHQLPDDFAQKLKTYRHPEKQDLFDDFSENTLSNFYLPFGVAPNFLINDTMYAIPMVVEESSVVAAASRSAAFWAQHGGFRTTIHNTLKKGHIWFEWNGPARLLNPMPDHLKHVLKEAVAPITENMEKRGGGIRKMTIEPLDEKPNVFQLSISFETRDSMGANFINSCLEEMKQPFQDYFTGNKELAAFGKPNVLMAILSNYTTECLVTTRVECPVKELSPLSAGMDPEKFAHRFKKAVDIAASDTSRAVTHNKGIFNGTDAVVIATGNDFRAAEAAGHAWAARHGKYQSLSHCHISDDNIFSMELTIPLALGTVGGLTRLHPMASLAIEMLGNPTAPELMGIAASAGLANNFSAVASLVTTGIQKGHMKLHLTNLLQSLGATSQEKAATLAHFQHKTVSAQAVKAFIEQYRDGIGP